MYIEYKWLSIGIAVKKYIKAEEIDAYEQWEYERRIIILKKGASKP